MEVVIAIAILSTGIITLLQGFSSLVRSTGFSCDIINAVFLAQDRLEELEFKERQALISQEPKEVSLDVDKFKSQSKLNLIPLLNLYRLDLSVKWLRANREEEINLNTYLRQ